MISTEKNSKLLLLNQKSTEAIESFLLSIGKKCFPSSKPCNEKGILDKYIQLFITELFLQDCHEVMGSEAEKYVNIIKKYSQFDIGGDKIYFCSRYFSSIIHPNCDVILISYNLYQKQFRVNILSSQQQSGEKILFKELSYNGMYRLLVNLERELELFTLSQGYIKPTLKYSSKLQK